MLENRSIPESLPSVSVIVPTIGRPELLRALESARTQITKASLEIVVVHDGAVGEELPDQASDVADRIIRTTGRVGGSRARNIGIESADGDVVALLDDDDEWLPNKIEAQLTLLGKSTDPLLTVVSGRQVFVNPRTDQASRPSPFRLIGADESIENYLFRRRPPSGGRPTMTTPTLLVPRTLARSVPWDESLKRHQDWDWLVRLGRYPGVRFMQVPEPVVRVFLGSALSISAGTDWQESLRWADRQLRQVPDVYADFLAAQSLRYALGARC